MQIHRCLFVITLLLLSVVKVYSHVSSMEIFDYSLIDFDQECVKINTSQDFTGHALFNYKDSTSHTQSNDTVNSANSIQKDFTHLKQNASVVRHTYSHLFSIIIPESEVGKRFYLHPTEHADAVTKIYVNGVLCVNNGCISTDTNCADCIPNLKTTVSTFIADTSTLDVQICTTPFPCSKDISFCSLYLGTEEQMNLRQERAIIKDLFVIVSLLIMALYHLVVFSVNRFDRRSLYFVLVCLLFSLNHSLQGTMCFFIICPNCVISSHSTLHLIILGLLPAFSVLLFDALFSNYLSKRVLYGLLVASFILVIVSIFATDTMRHFMIIPNIIFILGISTYCCFAIHHLLKSKPYNNNMFLIGFSICALCILNQALNSLQLIDTPSFVAFALTLFVILFSFSFGKITRVERKQTKELMMQLGNLNVNLENQVHLRTHELSQSLIKVRRFNQFQEGMSHMIAHDIKSPLMQVINLDNITEKDFPYIRHAGSSMLRMVENMLVLYKYNTNSMIVNYTIFEVCPIIEKALRDFIFVYTQKALRVEIISDAVYSVKADVKIFKRVIGNLLSNAFRYSPNEGVVQIRLQTSKDNSLKVSVSNQGPALSDKVKNRLFSTNGVSDMVKDAKHSTSGLGLYLCKMALDAHKGEIGVDSDGVRGVNFWLILPQLSVLDQQEIHKIYDHNANLNLSLDDIECLRPHVHELLKFKVYDTTKIDAILFNIPKSNVVIEQWIENVRKTCYSLDEAKLAAMLHHVLPM